MINDRLIAKLYVESAGKETLAAPIGMVPGAAELPDRLDAVLTVVHLLLTPPVTPPRQARTWSGPTWWSGPWAWPGCSAT